MSEFPVAVRFLDVLGKTTVPFLVTDPVRGVNFNTIKIHFKFIIMILAISSLIQRKRIIFQYLYILLFNRNHQFHIKTSLFNFEKENMLPVHIIKVISLMPVSEITLQLDVLIHE